MVGFLGRLAVPISAGFLLGMIAVFWIDPQEPGGILLLMGVCIALAIVFTALIKVVLVLRKSRSQKVVGERPDASQVAAATESEIREPEQ